MEKESIKEKIPGRPGWWDLMERFSAEFVTKMSGEDKFLYGPAHRHPMPELFVSNGKESLTLVYLTRKGKIREIVGRKIFVDVGIPHQILVPRGTAFEIYTCEENLRQEEKREKLEDFETY